MGKNTRTDAIYGYRMELIRIIHDRFMLAANEFTTCNLNDPAGANKLLGKEEAYNEILRLVMNDGLGSISKNNGEVNNARNASR